MEGRKHRSSLKDNIIVIIVNLIILKWNFSGLLCKKWRIYCSVMILGKYASSFWLLKKIYILSNLFKLYNCSTSVKIKHGIQFENVCIRLFNSCLLSYFNCFDVLKLYCLVVLLLDEPTVGLDPLSTYLIISMLSSYAR